MSKQAKYSLYINITQHITLWFPVLLCLQCTNITKQNNKPFRKFKTILVMKNCKANSGFKNFLCTNFLMISMVKGFGVFIIWN